MAKASDIRIELKKVPNTDNWDGQMFINEHPFKQVKISKRKSKEGAKKPFWYPLEIQPRNPNDKFWDGIGTVNFWNSPDELTVLFVDCKVDIAPFGMPPEILFFPLNGGTASDSVILTLNEKQLEKNEAQGPEYQWYKHYILETEAQEEPPF